MAPAPQFSVGDVGSSAVVLQGEHLVNLTLNAPSVEAVNAALAALAARAKPAYRGPLLRRLDPIVLVNRVDQLREMAEFFADPATALLYVHGLAGIGKSTLVRGALEFRKTETAAVWISCERLDPEAMLADLAAGMGLPSEPLPARLGAKFAAVLGAIQTPGILVLDGFEALLDDDGRVASPEMAEIVDALSGFEHRLKVLITTRLLPSGVGAGTPGVRILRLGGLSAPSGEQLLSLRMRNAVASAATLHDVVLRLRGHPKFIELVASVASELPLDKVATGLLSATDIGGYVLGEIFARLDADELALLRAARVFRDTFTFEALAAGYAALAPGGDLGPKLRDVVRRAVLDAAPGATMSYYLHPILRDAIAPDPAQDAAAQAAAAAWFGRAPFVASDPSSWDSMLYHLRLAAETDHGDDRVQRYANWVLDHVKALEYAGWQLRAVAELRAVAALVAGSEQGALVRFVLGVQLWQGDEWEEALAVFEDIVADPVVQDADTTLLVLAKMGDTLVRMKRLPEARAIADRIEPLVEQVAKTQWRLRHRELRFAIARAEADLPAMQRWAQQCLEQAQSWVAERRDDQTIDALAEAHFALAVAALRAGAMPDMFEHFIAQLRLKLEIGKLGGVLAALSSLGSTWSQVDPVAGGAMLLTAEQIASETQLRMADHFKQDVTTAVPVVLNSEAQARQAIAAVSGQLVPYYDRAVKRRRAPPAITPES